METQTATDTGLFGAILNWIGQQLPDPSTVGASSWIHLIYWVAGAVVALFAVGAFRQRAKQARATFLLNLDERWSKLEQQRRKMYGLRKALSDNIEKNNPGKNDRAREKLLRDRCKQEIERLRNNPSEIDLYEQFFAYLAFFETLGLMVRKRYVPLRDVVLLYKGPIIDIDIVFRDHIEEWQKHGNIPKGLLENMLYLIKWTGYYQRCGILLFWK